MNKNKIEKIIEQIKNNKFIHYSIIVLIGLVLSIFLFKIELRDTHDGILHLLRVMGTADTLEIGQIPPLINQNYCNGVGYSMNLFYQPIVTYVPLLIKIFTPTYAIAIKAFGGLCIIASGISMYQFTYQITKKRSIALFSAMFYLIAPYKLANVYKRFAIGEFTALVFLPWVFMGLYNLLEQGRKKALFYYYWSNRFIIISYSYYILYNFILYSIFFN